MKRILVILLTPFAVGCSESEPSSPDTGAPDTAVDGPITVPDLPPPDQGSSDLGSYAPLAWTTIQAGKFIMGSPTSEPCREITPHQKETEHEVTLTRSFEITTNEVTRGQFWAVVGYDPAPDSSIVGTLTCGNACPAIVTWSEAATYCAMLSKQNGKTSCYEDASSGKPCKIHEDCEPSKTQEACVRGSCYLYKAVSQFDGTTKPIYDCPGYRLPTEAEWEYAYRAGTTTALYNGPVSTGDCLMGYTDANADKIAWYKENAKVIQPVGQKQPNPWGLYDMAGNAGEWCHDCGDPDLEAAAVIDPCGHSNAPYRMVRGGAFASKPPHLRAATRINYAMVRGQGGMTAGDGIAGATGFRCVLTSP